MKRKYTVRGPVSNDGLWYWYEVVGPHGGVREEFYGKTDAKKYADKLNKEEKNNASK